MTGPDYSKRDYLLPKGCKDLADALVVNVMRDTTVAELATLLGQRPMRLIADLFQLGVFASERGTLKFDIVRKVAQKYGYLAQQA
jgi:Translation initiation factor IF-2, N-terminal region